MMSYGLYLDSLKTSVNTRKTDMQRRSVRSVRKICRGEFSKRTEKKFFKIFFSTILRTTGLNV